MNRRSMLKWVINGIGLATAAMAGIPSLITAFAPLSGSQSQKNVWKSIGSLENFPIGVMRPVVVQLPEQEWGSALVQKTIYAWRPSAQEAIVYSRSCTDLGCPLTYDQGSECFFCPCHGGIFSKNGDRMAGPPTRPMYRYANKMLNGEILIDLRSIPLMAQRGKVNRNEMYG